MLLLITGQPWLGYSGFKCPLCSKTLWGEATRHLHSPKRFRPNVAVLAPKPVPGVVVLPCSAAMPAFAVPTSATTSNRHECLPLHLKQLSGQLLRVNVHSGKKKIGRWQCTVYSGLVQAWERVPADLQSTLPIGTAQRCC